MRPAHLCRRILWAFLLAFWIWCCLPNIYNRLHCTPSLIAASYPHHSLHPYFFLHHQFSWSSRSWLIPFQLPNILYLEAYVVNVCSIYALFIFISRYLWLLILPVNFHVNRFLYAGTFGSDTILVQLCNYQWIFLRLGPPLVSVVTLLVIVSLFVIFDATGSPCALGCEGR